MNLPRARLAGALALLLVACSSRGSEPARAPEVPAYSPESALLFDDVLAPQLFGFDPEGRDPAKDPKLAERTVRADVVFPARVETLSRLGGVEHRSSYELIVRPEGPALAGTTPVEPVVLAIAPSNPAYLWVEGAGARWVGTRLILFGKRFRDANGTTLRFRGEPDSKEVRAAIRRHVPLRMLRR